VNVRHQGGDTRGPDDNWLGSNSELAGLIRALSWADTPLGPLSEWPQSLRATLALCLAAPFPVAIHWGPGRITLYNDAYRDVLAHKHPWALGRPAPEVWRDLWDVLQPLLDRAVASGQGTWSEDLPVLQQRQGRFEERSFCFSLVPVGGEEQQIGGVLSTVTETTGRARDERPPPRHSEEQLRRSEAHLAQAQRLSGTGSWAFHVATKEIYWSLEHYRMFGIDAGKTPTFEMIVEQIHPEDRQRLARAWEYALDRWINYALDFRIIRPDGEIRHIRSLAQPVWDRSGTLVEYVGTVIDMTEQVRAIEQVRQSEHRFRLLVDSIPHHVWSYRLDGTVGFWNQRLSQYTGLTAAELQNGGWDALHPGDVERVRQAWRRVAATGASYEQEHRIRGRDGLYRRFLSRGTPVRDERGQVYEWFGTDTDVEDHRRAAEALQQAQAELTHVTRLTTLGELAGSLAHELNQPLAAIAMNAAAAQRWLARDEPNLERAREAVERIARDADRAGYVVAHTRGLLQKSRNEKAELDIVQVVRAVLVLIHAEAARHEVVIQENLEKGLPPVLGARVLLQQVLLNLVVNGIEAMTAVADRPRALVIRAQPHHGENGLGVLVAVEDAGVGFGQQDPDRLFDAFYTTKPDGLGMGLSISRSIIEEHGGRLWADRNPGPGATFQFVLPGASVEGP
jgi:PAS domain S-box-containing protein